MQRLRWRRSRSGLVTIFASIAILLTATEAKAADQLGAITEFGTANGLNAGSFPYAIAAGPDGNVWFTDQGNPKAIGRISTSGAITEFSAGIDPGSYDNGITAGPDGNLWFTDNGLSFRAIGRITPAGTVDEFGTAHGLDANSNPAYIAAGPEGNL